MEYLGSIAGVVVYGSVTNKRCGEKQWTATGVMAAAGVLVEHVHDGGCRSTCWQWQQHWFAYAGCSLCRLPACPYPSLRGWLVMGVAAMLSSVTALLPAGLFSGSPGSRFWLIASRLACLVHGWQPFQFLRTRRRSGGRAGDSIQRNVGESHG